MAITPMAVAFGFMEMITQILRTTMTALSGLMALPWGAMAVGVIVFLSSEEVVSGTPGNLL